MNNDVNKPNGKNGNRNGYNSSYDKEDEKLDYKNCTIPKIANVPQHVLELAAILKYNANTRYYCSLNIIQYLKDNKIIKENANPFVRFLWNKFQVRNNGLTTEYRYSETFFFIALIKSFNDFAQSGASKIYDYCIAENIDMSEFKNYFIEEAKEDGEDSANSETNK